MTETLGVAAAVVQMTDFGSRMLLASSRLCSDLSNVPSTFSTMRNHMQQFHALLCILKIDFENMNQRQSTQNADLTRSLTILTGLLNEAVEQAKELSTLLEKLNVTGKTPLQRVWNVVVSVKMEEEILGRWGRLESLKGSLQLWYQHQSMQMISEQVLVLC